MLVLPWGILGCAEVARPVRLAVVMLKVQGDPKELPVTPALTEGPTQKAASRLWG